jgi:hypothetical protein
VREKEPKGHSGLIFLLLHRKKIWRKEEAAVRVSDIQMHVYIIFALSETNAKVHLT